MCTDVDNGRLSHRCDARMTSLPARGRLDAHREAARLLTVGSGGYVGGKTCDTWIDTLQLRTKCEICTLPPEWALKAGDVPR